MEQTKRVAFAVLGCRTNQYELQAMKEQLAVLGFDEAREGETADLCIINTCAVTEAAESSSRHAIRALISQHPGARVVVTGCFASRDPATLRSIPGVTDVITNENKETVIAQLFPDATLPPFSITTFGGHTRAFIKIQDGCNCFCSYCIVPLLRGRSRSRDQDDILHEVSAVVASGHKEIVLTGINIGDYAGRLSDLMRAIDAIPGVKRLRISSINPNDVTDDVIAALLEGKTTCPNLHLVLQSGSNAILERMRRPYLREAFLQVVERLRKGNPHFTFTTDVIVGFPGETDADFDQTLDVVRTVHFAKVHMFPYSKRPRTYSARFTDEVSQEQMNERRAILLRESDRLGFEWRAPFVGTIEEVLTEGGEENGLREGQTRHGFSVFIPKDSALPNQLVRVCLKENRACGLFGEVVE